MQSPTTSRSLAHARCRRRAAAPARASRRRRSTSGNTASAAASARRATTRQQSANCSRPPRGVEAEQVGAEQAVEQFEGDVVGKHPEVLRRHPRRVGEMADAHVWTQRAQHPRARAAGGSPAPSRSRPRAASAAAPRRRPGCTGRSPPTAAARPGRRSACGQARRACAAGTRASSWRCRCRPGGTSARRSAASGRRSRRRARRPPTELPRAARTSARRAIARSRSLSAAQIHTASGVADSAACMPLTSPPPPRRTSSSPSSTATIDSGPRLEATISGARPGRTHPSFLPCGRFLSDRDVVCACGGRAGSRTLSMRVAAS